ncbi:hypothetical protein [Finegoldia magna]
MIFIIVLWGKHFPLMKYRGYKKIISIHGYSKNT